MRFSIKIFICTMLVVAMSFAVGGSLLIDRNFEMSKDREVSRARGEFLSLRFMLESGIISEELQRNAIDDAAVGRVAGGILSALRQDAGQNEKNIEIYDGARRLVYTSAPLAASDKYLFKLTIGQVDCHIDKSGGAYVITVSGLFTFDTAKLYLSYFRDISQVFADRDAQIKDFMLYDVLIVIVGAAVVFLLSLLLTRPVRKLTAASRRIAGGEYGVRARVRSSDEVGELTESFNTMAGAVEEKINELELASKRKDEFIANFTHELKTPMTSIIGYADMLRSKECDGQTVFKAASFIFSEGRRLEALSLKMLDLLLLEKHEFALRPVDCGELLEYISESVAPAFAQSGVTLDVSAREGSVLAEPDLIKTLLINLADNARKASPAGAEVELTGREEGDRYLISMTDHGRGIPEGELGKITEAFYMVDRARSRAQHGAGLGLAIASRIAELHGTKLGIQSIVGLGTCASVSLELFQSQGGGNEEE